MAGGKGERFWPLSTERRPKQMLALAGDRPLLAAAVERLRGVIPKSRILVVTGASLLRAARQAVPGLPGENLIGEPVGRDTAAACALGTAIVGSRDPEGVVCVLTADHVIGDEPRFRDALRAAVAVADVGRDIVTFGIRPRFPSTGFGYIETGRRIGSVRGVRFARALRFVEKPDTATAARYVASGRYLWNSGMFIWKVGCFMDALERHAPALRRMAGRLAAAAGGAGFGRLLRREYGRIGRISVDYAVMEKSANIVTAAGDFGWDDVGSWSALAAYLPRDGSGNAVSGRCETVDAAGNVVLSGGRLTALVGVRDLVVVQAAGATLVCGKDRAEDVKKMVRLLREKGGYGGLL
jgi:mannose-1-phosphate guanylyltransferase